jgi:phosphopantothenoylcysteine decarboxylase/phosphopantothenate--cysteine ligase
MKQEASGTTPVTRYLSGKKVLITAGPTMEKIDDVRFISNYSSGKMGYALASQAEKAGADVVLVSGPVSIVPPENVRTIIVQTAEEMYDAATREFDDASIAVLAAAVADYTPASPAGGKIKKEEAGEAITLQLKTTKDILAQLGSVKRQDQVLVGFALESINEIENGWKKLKNKNCDMIVVNTANKPQSGFGGDDNTITLLTRDGIEKSYPPMSKELCASVILKKAVEL